MCLLIAPINREYVFLHISSRITFDFDGSGMPASQFPDTMGNVNCVNVPIVEGLFPYNLLRNKLNPCKICYNILIL